MDKRQRQNEQIVDLMTKAINDLKNLSDRYHFAPPDPVNKAHCAHLVTRWKDGKSFCASCGIRRG